MGEIAIQAEGLSKRYRIGGTRAKYATLRESLVDSFRSFFQRADDPTSRVVWALKDVSFEVCKGDVLGIIGRNGAGKSTLLKILSRITKPTSGWARVSGRVGSLLEVGTGFHPELTGRENVFLNGAILGMKRSEIRQKFDAIVDFAEIERFLDTPVKHYSSGMYMRLAFSVAAHLEPDILLVDEVLAVGDMAFQKKCLGKMGDVAKTGRTVVFVSHNMAAIHRLCNRCFLIDRGSLKDAGPTGKVVASYLEQVASAQLSADADIHQETEVRFIRASFLKGDEKTFSFSVDEDFTLSIEYVVNAPVVGVHIGVWLLTPEGFVIMSAYDTDTFPQLATSRSPGRYRASMRIRPGLLNAGEYLVRLLAFVPHGKVYDDNSSLSLQLIDTRGESAHTGWGHRVGPIVPHFSWEMTAL